MLIKKYYKTSRNNMWRRYIKFAIFLCMILALIACDNNNVSNKTTSIADEISATNSDNNSEKLAYTPSWSEYDNLMDKISTCADLKYRVKLMHKAEDMVINTGACIPIYYPQQYYLKKEELKGVTYSSLQRADISYAYIEGKDEISVRYVGELQHLAYNLSSTTEDAAMNLLLSATLVKFDENDMPKPYAAKSIDISDDKLTYTFHLRENLKWSDGSKLDADDFVYSFLWSSDINNAALYRNFFEYINGFPDNLNIKSEDNGKTFVVKLKAPCPYFLSMLTYPVFMPLKKSDIEKYDKSNPYAWGQDIDHCYSGPFMISKWNRKNSMILKKNPYFFDKDNIKTETLNLMFSTDPTVVLNAYNDGDICFSNLLSNSIIKKLKGTPELIEKTMIVTNYLLINVKSDIFAGMTANQACTFRRAIGYALDKEFLINVALNGNGKIANTIVPKETLDGNNELFCRNTEDYSYPYKEDLGYYPLKRDLDKARELLSSIGYEFDKNGKLTEPITIEYLFSSSGSATNIFLECFQQDLLDIGIRIKPVTVDSAYYLSELKCGHFQMSTARWYLDYSDPYSILEIFKTNHSSNAAQLGR